LLRPIGFGWRRGLPYRRTMSRSSWCFVDLRVTVWSRSLWRWWFLLLSDCSVRCIPQSTFC